MATLLYSHCLKTRGELHPGLGRPGSQIKSFILMQLTHYAQSWVRDFSEEKDWPLRDHFLKIMLVILLFEGKQHIILGPSGVLCKLNTNW